MEKAKNMFVSNLELQHYLGRVQFGGITSSKMADYCDYLDGKVIRDNNELAQHVFLSQATKMGDFSPYYTEETEKYIKSKAFSDKIKKWILTVMKKLDDTEDLRKKIKSCEEINDLDKDTLFDIEEALARVGSGEEELLSLFERYMFVLDGDGPFLFIKLKYTDMELASQFLTRSNIDTETEVGNGLLVEYMMSIYKMYKKYMPQDYVDKYVRFIREGNFLSQKEFSLGYKAFVQSGFKIRKEVKHSIDKKEDKEENHIKRENNHSRKTTKKLFMKSLDVLQTDEHLESVVKRLIYTMDPVSENTR